VTKKIEYSRQKSKGKRQSTTNAIRATSDEFMRICGRGSLRACGHGLDAERVKHIAGTRRVGGEFYRRQSALRTIKGGIWAGLGLRRLLLTQLLLLGYH